MSIQNQKIPEDRHQNLLGFKISQKNITNYLVISKTFYIFTEQLKATNMKLSEIHNTGIINANFNGLWKQEIIFITEEKNKYRITINSTKPVVILSKWSDGEGWLFVLEKRTIGDFKIDTAYKPKERVPENVYEPIIKAMKKLIQQMFE